MAVLLFGGQGSQHVGMGKDFYNHLKLAREMFEEASDVLKTGMQALLWEENELLNQSPYTQSALFLVSMVAFRAFIAEVGSFSADMALGHSLGEISANGASGALSFEKGLKLVFERGRLMENVCAQSPKELGMLAVLGASKESLIDFCTQAREKGQVIYTANFNGSQVVLAGYKEILQTLQAKDLGAKKLVMLPMSVVSHCPILTPMLEDFKAILAESLEDTYSFGVLSNANGSPYQSKEDALKYLGVQLIQPVLYDTCLQSCESSTPYYLEFGTSVLKNLNKRLSNKSTLSIVDMPSLQEALNFVAQAPSL
ncbi:ACP S-malonyltransferase [Helicobacter cynogastricus]|uniref:[acyl-carrier-protein] S-malonyltransferase n=1 Tax=Helicobacter cynogastricus TaxID=329937 RepID=A0A1R3UFJ2_9HELI|nr:acyltransferase domain-containing protein [Helicobacter cynogastricus]SFZ72055.1 OMP13 [Helicobacter cynogastricus]